MREITSANIYGFSYSVKIYIKDSMAYDILKPDRYLAFMSRYLKSTLTLFMHFILASWQICIVIDYIKFNSFIVCSGDSNSKTRLHPYSYGRISNHQLYVFKGWRHPPWKLLFFLYLIHFWILWYLHRVGFLYIL